MAHANLILQRAVAIYSGDSVNHRDLTSGHRPASPRAEIGLRWTIEVFVVLSMGLKQPTTHIGRTPEFDCRVLFEKHYFATSE
jgi:hypothetical protein